MGKSGDFGEVGHFVWATEEKGRRSQGKLGVFSRTYDGGDPRRDRIKRIDSASPRPSGHLRWSVSLRPACRIKRDSEVGTESRVKRQGLSRDCQRGRICARCFVP
jgi:hypothetical protein